MIAQDRTPVLPAVTKIEDILEGIPDDEACRAERQVVLVDLVLASSELVRVGHPDHAAVRQVELMEV